MLPLVGMVLLVQACASDVANRYYAKDSFVPKPADQVELLYDAPNRPYEVIADFQSRGESPRQLRAKAARIGADAVIVVPLGGLRAFSDEWADEDTYKKTNTRIVGTAIKYKGGDWICALSDGRSSRSQQS